MRLKELRKENKKTLQDMANILEISQPAYFKYESGENKPTIDNLIKLANYFNVSLDYLVGREFANEVGYLTQTQKMLLQIINELTEYNQAKLLGMAQGLLVGQN